MNVLMSIMKPKGASELAQTRAHIEPLSRVDKINSIYVVRDAKGLDVPKVRYYYPPRLSCKSLLIRWIYKFFLMIYLGTSKKIDLVCGVHLYLHGLIAFLVGKLTRKKIAIILIAGEKETSYYGKLMEKLVLFCLKRTDLVLVTGKRTEEHLIKKGVQPNQVQIQPNVIQVNSFMPKAVEKKYDIVSHGRLAKGKNLESLLEIVVRLKHTKPDLKLAIAGNGNLMDNLKAKALQLGLDQNVSFLGFVTDICSFLNSGRIYVLTSEHEGLPIAMLEAMCCGLPCVVTGVGDIGDIVINRRNAILIEDPFDILSFVRAIEELLHDEVLYREMSENAFRTGKTQSIECATEIWKKNLARLFEDDV